MTQFLIGLTGGIGSGKSAAAERFAHHGICIVDADVASRVVVEPGRPALESIAEHFSSDILASDGSLDRAALRQVVFSIPAERAWLQSLLHPLITQYLHEQIASAASVYVMLANPLLFETRQHSWCNRVLVIDVPEAVQMERTMARDKNSREQVENIMRAQSGRKQRLAQADDVIENVGNLEALNANVDRLHNQYLELCQKHPE